MTPRRGFDFLKKNKSMTDPKTGMDCNNCLSMSDCNLCHLILNFLTKIPTNLPFITAILFSQENHLERKEGRRKTNGLLETRPFLDSGASSDFISKEFADFLIKENFKIEKLNSSCSVGLASHDHCLKAHDLINFELKITDEFGVTSLIEVKAYVLPIKYSIVLGLPTMKRNNLTFRFPSIFASEDKQDVLLCKPCEPKVSEGEGNKPIRTSRVTSSSTYPDETKVNKVR